MTPHFEGYKRQKDNALDIFVRCSHQKWWHKKYVWISTPTYGCQSFSFRLYENSFKQFFLLRVLELLSCLKNVKGGGGQ